MVLLPRELSEFEKVVKWNNGNEMILSGVR
jgi:hypothetical protein